MSSNFESINYFIFPKKITFGLDSVKKVKDEINLFRANKILVVTDKVLHKIGLVEKVSENLDEKEIIFYDIFEGEPTIESVSSAVDFVRESKPDAVIGLGGGSILDTAKLIAALFTNPGELTEYVAGWEDKFKVKPLPKILIPTTSGTGSENTRTSVVIENGVKKYSMSNFLYADSAIVDPSLTLTCHPNQTAYSGIDALSHAMDAIFSVQVNPLCRSLAEEVISLASRNLSKAYHTGDDLKARWNMSMASTLGGLLMNFATSGWPIHLFAEYFGAKYKIPHGLACAIVMPYVMDFLLPSDSDTFFSIAERMGEDVKGKSVEDGARQSIKRVIKLFEDLEIPTSMKDLKVQMVDLEKHAEFLLKEGQYIYGTPTFIPRKFNAESIKLLIENIHQGKKLL